MKPKIVVWATVEYRNHKSRLIISIATADVKYVMINIQIGRFLIVTKTKQWPQQQKHHHKTPVK